MVWLSISVFFTVLVVGVISMKRNEMIQEEKIQIFLKILNRNKLKDTANDSIDDIVKFSKDNNISFELYC